MIKLEKKRFPRWEGPRGIFDSRGYNITEIASMRT
jgi:hypothetical protein